MRRLIKVLAAGALMVVLMATTVSPAFADPHKRELPGTDKKTEEVHGEGFGSEYGCIQHGGNHTNCGWHAGTN